MQLNHLVMWIIGIHHNLNNCNNHVVDENVHFWGPILAFTLFSENVTKHSMKGY
jgi:hypothetical protein